MASNASFIVACGAVSQNSSASTASSRPVPDRRRGPHHTIDMPKMLPCLRDIGDPAIDDDRHVGQRALQAIDPVIVERRDVAVFLRRQALQPGLSGVHDQRVRAGLDHAARQRIERRFRILIVDSDPAFHGDRNLHRALHRGNALGDEFWLRHQAGAETALLDAVGRTADVEIDLVITEIFADHGRRRQIARHRPAKLQRQRILARVEAEQPRPIAMQDRAGRQHLRVKPRPPRQQTVEHPAMPVGPIHHGRHGKAIIVRFQQVTLIQETEA
jgi:hypothetical protein